MSLPGSVHACFYSSAVADPTTFAAFANCQLTDGGEQCIRDIPAGLNCLSNTNFQGRDYSLGLKFPQNFPHNG